MVVMEGFADPMVERTKGAALEETTAQMSPCGARGVAASLESGMPWNEGSGQCGHGTETLAESQNIAPRCLHSRYMDSAHVLRQSAVPTLVLHHTDDVMIPPEWARTA